MSRCARRFARTMAVVRRAVRRWKTGRRAVTVVLTGAERSSSEEAAEDAMVRNNKMLIVRH